MFSHDIVVSIDGNDIDFYIEVTLKKEDISFDHEFGIEGQFQFVVDEFICQRIDNGYLTMRTKDIVFAHYEKYYKRVDENNYGA